MIFAWERPAIAGRDEGGIAAVTVTAGEPLETIVLRRRVGQQISGGLEWSAPDFWSFRHMETRAVWGRRRLKRRSNQDRLGTGGFFFKRLDLMMEFYSSGMVYTYHPLAGKRSL